MNKPLVLSSPSYNDPYFHLLALNLLSLGLLQFTSVFPHFTLLKYFIEGELYSTMDNIVALHLEAPGAILGIPANFSLDVAEI